MLTTDDIIAAPATASGGALGIIRISGAGSVECCAKIFRSRRPLTEAAGYTAHYGSITDARGETIDDVIVTVFRAPHSYTGEDAVEISHHGSQYIAGAIMHRLVEAGARMASAGEFSARAFLAGKLDLAQAEAVAEVIASDTQWSHALAASHMKGTFSDSLHALREELLHALSMLELELDFGEEEVVFADRRQIRRLTDELNARITHLRDSFRAGNAIKEGVAVVIAGAPNVGKSTLLNRLAEEDRAMVSDIAGTTRDTIEASTVIDGVKFRFTDTAGLHDSDDMLERMGIERTRRAMQQADIILHVVTPETFASERLEPAAPHQRTITVVNKCDTAPDAAFPHATAVSAKFDKGIDTLRHMLRATIDTQAIARGEAVVSSARHYEALARAAAALAHATSALDRNAPTDLLSEDLRTVADSLGEITGEITSDDILRNIFSKFCIGK